MPESILSKVGFIVVIFILTIVLLLIDPPAEYTKTCPFAKHFKIPKINI